MDETGENEKKKIIKVLLIITILIISIIGLVVFFIYQEYNSEYLFVETEHHWRTELVSGNYTDGHECFDFPHYSVDEKNHIIDDWENEKHSDFKVIYGSGNFGSGLIDSGGASRLKYLKELPFNVKERIPFGNS
jgi:hypothetical protein